MKTTLSIIFAALIFQYTIGQTTTENPQKYIEVTGSAEMEIEPDEISLIIGIQEYWEEEFENNPKSKNFKTKVPIGSIQAKLFSDLEKIGISMEQISVMEVGNFWRMTGKDFLFGKTVEIMLGDFGKLDEILQTIDTKGIDYMRIGQLKHKNFAEYRKQVKREALKAAETKAGYLLESIGEELGGIISIVEMEEDYLRRRARNLTSNSYLPAAEGPGMDNMRKIKLRYEIKVKFEIK